MSQYTNEFPCTQGDVLQMLLTPISNSSLSHNYTDIEITCGQFPCIYQTCINALGQYTCKCVYSMLMPLCVTNYSLTTN